MGNQDQTIRLDSIRPNNRNPRKIDAKALARLAESIKRDPDFMCLRPIVVDSDGVIIGGNQRHAACLSLSMTEVPASWIVRADSLTPEQRKRFVVLDNGPSGASGEWDWDMLAADWSIPDLESLGMDITRIPTPVEKGDDDEVPIDRAAQLQTEWRTERGQLWQLGSHRLLCGDATSKADVDRLLGDAKPMLMVTDPPYGVEYDPTCRDDVGGIFGNGKTVMRGTVANDDRCDWREAWALFPGDIAYVWHASLKCSEVLASLHSVGFAHRAQIIWVKQQFTLARTGYHWQHEPCWYCVRDGGKAHWVGDRKGTTVWQIESLNACGRTGAVEDREAKLGHGTQKPVECFARPIRNHESEFVYDPFCGSGSSVIACERLGRKALAMELEPQYIAVILQRYLDATGVRPVIIQ